MTAEKTGSVSELVSEESSTQVEERACKVVLYIEDDPHNMELMGHIIARSPGLNANMLKANNAELGIELARKHQPDLVLMDINLPGINGDEALRRLRYFQETRDIPVVAISANAMPHNIESATTAGFEAFVTKPVNVGMLRETISKLLNI